MSRREGPRVAAVGHVEWTTFARVERLPRQGEIVHAVDAWEEAAGGGAVAAVKLGGAFFTVLGDDELGRRARDRLHALGVGLHAVHRGEQRRALVHVDSAGERTITVVGERHVPVGGDALPWDELAQMDAVYFTGGDADAARAARRARVLVASPRSGAGLAESGVELDALVYSTGDEDEAAWAQAVTSGVRYRVATGGAQGGRWIGADGRTGTWAVAELPGPVADAYGCGDSFAAGLTYGLGADLGIERALALGAEWAARTLTLRGPYGR